MMVCLTPSIAMHIDSHHEDSYVVMHGDASNVHVTGGRGLGSDWLSSWQHLMEDEDYDNRDAMPWYFEGYP